MRNTTWIVVLLLCLSDTTHGARGTFKETVLGEEKVAKAAEGIEVKTKITLPQQGTTGLCDADLSNFDHSVCFFLGIIFLNLIIFKLN